jgi:iron complex transport system ATP-binding protein
MEPFFQVCDLETGYFQKSKTLKVGGPYHFELKPGIVYGLIGNNGSGKSTLLRTLMNFQKPLRGDILLNGEPLQSFSRLELARTIGVALTGTPSISWMNCKDYIALGRTPYQNIFGFSNGKDEKVVEEVLLQTDLLELKNRFIHEMSDGEKQRAQIGRLLAQQVRFMFLDEPTAFLDPFHKDQIFKLFRKMAKEHQTGVLVSSHDLDLVFSFCDQILLLCNHGEMIQGSPTEILRDKHLAKEMKLDQLNDRLSRSLETHGI